MIFNTQPPSMEGEEPVRLIGVGEGGQRLVAELHRGARGPLADLLGASLELQSSWRGLEEIHEYDLTGVALLFIAIALDATDDEGCAGLYLSFRASQIDAKVICIVLTPTNGANTKSQSLVDLLTANGIDGRIGMKSDADEDALQALRWVYGAMRSLSRDGFLLLEPAWDLFDVVEVLDFPGSHLKLATQTVPRGISILEAVSNALEELRLAGADLALASGILLVLWQAPGQTLYARDVRHAARMVGNALGAGGLHLTLTARSTVPWGDIGACATVVLSTRGTFGRPEPHP